MITIYYLGVAIMRGHDIHQDAMFTYLSPEARGSQRSSPEAVAANAYFLGDKDIIL